MTLILDNKIALITGASRGIGAAVAIKYASLGAHVILVARKLKGLEAVDDAIKADGNGSATLVTLDLRKSEKIDQLTLSIAERFGRLDILVGNAAILGDLTPLTSVSDKVWDEVMAVNVTANHRLIRNFDPLLQQSEAGRALFVTSGITKSRRPFWGAYAASKAALEMMVEIYAQEIASTNVKANLIDPAVVATQMRQAAFPGEDQATLISPTEIAGKFVAPVLSSFTDNGIIVR